MPRAGGRATLVPCKSVHSAGVITAKSGNTATVRLTDGRSADFSADVAVSRVNYFDEDLKPSGSETFFSSGSKLGISSLSEDADGVKSFMCSLPGSSVGQRVAMACGSNYGRNIVLWGSSGSIDNAVFEDVTVANSFGMVMLVRGVRNSRGTKRCGSTRPSSRTSARRP